MKVTFRKVLTGAGAMALAGGALVATGGSALATNAPYYPDAGATLGGINFYDSTGAPVTSGSTSAAPFFGAGGFAVAQDAAAAGVKATMFAYTPVNGSPTGSWGGAQIGGAFAYPISAPASLANLPFPIAGATSGDTTIASYAAVHPNTNSDPAWQGLYEIREKVTGAPGYAAADILVSGTTWTQVDGTYTPAADVTSTALVGTPTGPSVHGTNVTLTATVTDTTSGFPPIGSVTFFDAISGSPVQVGTTQTLSATGTASVVDSSPPAIGTHPYTAVFTASNPAGFATSTGSLSYKINDFDVTKTALVANPTTGQTNAPVALTATVSDFTDGTKTPTGIVTFLDGSTPIGTAPVGAGGVASLPNYTGFSTTGTQTLSASYAPTAGSVFAASTSPTISYIVTTPACAGTTSTACVDPQTVQAEVLAGVLTITTPYSGVDPAHTLDLGTLVLNGTGTLLTASAPFGSTANGSASEIFVTDTQQSNANWTASVQAGQFTSGSSTPIDGQYAGLTNVAVVNVGGNALNSSNVNAFQNPAGTSVAAVAPFNGIGGAPHKFGQSTAGGDGSVGFTGTFTLNAPTSTVAGTYVGIVTFTVG